MQCMFLTRGGDIKRYHRLRTTLSRNNMSFEVVNHSFIFLIKYIYCYNFVNNDNVVIGFGMVTSQTSCAVQSHCFIDRTCAWESAFFP